MLSISLRLAALALALPVFAHAHPSDVDPTFGIDGYYIASDRTIDVISESSCGTLLAGRTATGIYLRCMNLNGSLRSSFGGFSSDTITINLQGTPVRLVPTIANDCFLGVQRDVAAGAAEQFSVTNHLYFSSSISTFSPIITSGVLVDLFSDTRGRLYVIWNSPTTAATPQWHITRHAPDGALDTSFGTGGSVTGDGQARSAAQLSGEHFAIYYTQEVANGTGFDTAWKRQLLDGDGADLAQEDLPSGNEVFEVGLYKVSTVPGMPGEDEGRFGFSPSSPGVPPVPPAFFPYADGMLAVLGDTLATLKFLTDGSPDTGWNNGSEIRGDYVPEGVGPAGVTLNTLGGVMLAVNTNSPTSGISHSAAPGVMLRVVGSQADTTPGYLDRKPRVTLVDDMYYSNAIRVHGLDDNAWVPARLSRGELSVDGGATWWRGWLWVKNGSRLLVRYSAVDLEDPASPPTLILGGYLLPSNPMWQVGLATSVYFQDSDITVYNATPRYTNVTDGAAAAGGSGGGSADPLLFAAVALLAGLLRRRPRTAH